LLGEIEAGKHEVLELGLKAAEISGYIFGDLHRAGRPIGGADPFIAAIALVEELPLVTGNFDHYERIVDLGYPLSLENWRS
jgi:predicted nucleic acid-binding protein